MGDSGSLLGDPSDPSLGGPESDLGGLDDGTMPGSLGGEEDGLGDLGGLGDGDMSGLMGDSGSDLGLGEDLMGSGAGEDDMNSLLGDDSMTGSELSAMGGEGFAGAAPAEDEAENPCSCTHHLLECEISDQLVSLSEQERSTTMTSMFAWACDQPSGCAYLNEPTQLLHCSDYQKLSWVYNEYYKAKGKSPENCNWSGYAQLATPTEPTTNCQSMLSNMGLMGGSADQGMSAASGDDLAMGGDFAGMGDDSAAFGDDLSSMGGDASSLTDDFSSLGGDSMIGGGAEEDPSSLAGSGADSMFGDLSADGSASMDGTLGMGADGAPSEDLASLMGDAGAPSDDMSSLMGDAGAGAELPSDGASISGGERPQLAESALKQKRDWRARRA